MPVLYAVYALALAEVKAARIIGDAQCIARAERELAKIQKEIDLYSRVFLVLGVALLCTMVAAIVVIALHA